MARTNYRKHFRASYIVREVRSVRKRERELERERERERERRQWRHHCRAKLGDEFKLFLAKIRNFRFSLHTSCVSLLKWSPLWRSNSSHRKNESNEYQKTIGKEKRDCAWGCARGYTTPEKIFRSKSASQKGVRSAHRIDLCFSIWRSRWCLSPERNLTHHLFFLFPIVFGINSFFGKVSFFYYTHTHLVSDIFS